MNNEGSKNLNSATAVEKSASDPQQQPLLAAGPTQPPTYQQATATNAPTAATTTTTNGPTVVVVNEPASIYGPHPVDVQCPYCHNYCRTRLRHEPNSRTHLIALMFCLLQLYCCICLPYCIGNCMNVNHYCGICDRFLGTFKR